MQLRFCLVVTNDLMSIKNKKWPERKQELRAEFQVKIWIKPVTDNHWNDAVDAGLVPHGSMCLLIHNKLWKLLCNRQPSWLRYLAVLHSAAPSDSETQGQRDYSIKYISIKAFFPPNVQTYAFLISFSKTTRYWFWTAFLCSWLCADQAKSWGVVGGALTSFSSEMLFWCGASSVKGHLKSFCWEEAIGGNPASDEGVWERRIKI